MESLEKIWRNKTDPEVAQAAANLKDYLPEAQDVIRAECERRGSDSGLLVERKARERKGPNAQEFTLASRGDRFAAQIGDALIAVAPLLAVFSISLVSRFAPAIPLGLAALFFIAYLLFADALPGGQSWAKKGLGISVIAVTSRKPCNAWRSFVRNLSLLVLGILDWAFIFGKMHQRLGDVLAGTIVVNARSGHKMGRINADSAGNE